MINIIIAYKKLIFIIPVLAVPRLKCFLRKHLRRIFEKNFRITIFSCWTMDIKKDGRSTHCYCENPPALGFRKYHNRDTMGFTTSHLGIRNSF